MYLWSSAFLFCLIPEIVQGIAISFTVTLKKPVYFSMHILKDIVSDADETNEVKTESLSAVDGNDDEYCQRTTVYKVHGIDNFIIYLYFAEF